MRKFYAPSAPAEQLTPAGPALRTLHQYHQQLRRFLLLMMAIFIAVPFTFAYNGNPYGMAPGKQLVILTPDVGDRETIARELDASMKVFQLSGDRSTLQQISEVLRANPGAEAVHLVSHGYPGSLQLGNEKLDASNLAEHAETIRQWGRSLAPGGNFLLYGCEVAKGRAGTAFIKSLADLLQAPVAASVDLTGAAHLGGNWILERHIGQIHVPSLAISGYNGLLQTTPPNGVYTFANAVNNNDGSFTTADGFFLISAQNGSSAGGQNIAYADEFGAFLMDALSTTSGTSYLEIKVKNGGSFIVGGAVYGDYDYEPTTSALTKHDFYNVYAVGYAEGVEVARTPTHNSIGIYEEDYQADFSAFAGKSIDAFRVYFSWNIGTAQDYFNLVNLNISGTTVTPPVSLPTVTSITSASPNPTSAASVTYTVSFSQAVTGVSTSNFSLNGTASNASINSVSGSGTTWIVSVNTGAVDGTVTLSLANATGISPGIGTALPYAGSQYTIDKTAPTLMITSNKSQLKAGETATITFTFSEDPAATFTDADIAVSGGTLSAITGSGTTRTAVFTPIANVNAGTASITVGAGSYRDAAGNNGGAGSSPSLIYDTQAPAVQSINRVNASPTTATSVTYTVTFSEAVTGVDASDFTVTTASGTATGTVASVSGGGTTYTVTINAVTGAGELRLDLKNSGTGISDGAGNAVSGYTSGQSYTIGFGPATITFAALPTKTYGDADFAPGATSSNSATPITYTSSNTSVATIVSGKIHIVGAGTTTITASQPAGNGYSTATDVTRQLTVNKASLTAMADNKTKIYGQPNPALTVQFVGFVNGDDASAFSTPVTLSTTAQITSSVGNYTILVSGGVAANYTIDTYQYGSLTIGKAPLTITADNATKVYGAVNPALSVSYSGFVNGDNSSKLTTQPTLSTSVTNTSAVGNYTISVSGAAASNYNLSYVSGVLTVTPAPLTITAANVNKTYGQTLTGGTGSTAFTQSGLVNGETIGTVAITYGTGAAATDAAGTYASQVTPSAATGGTFNPANYSITYSKGSIIVGAATPTITFGAITAKSYGTADFDPGATSTNTVTPITYTSSNTSVATIVNGKIHIVGVGTTTITASQAAEGSYNAATDVQQSLTVNKGYATLSLSGLTQTYNGTPRAVTVSTNPAGLSGVSITYNGATTAPTVAGSYAVVAKLTNSNYTATDATGTLIISAATSTITFTALPTKTYGDADFAPGATSNNTATAITYTSSNTAVATIISNNIHIVGVGTTIITASQAADANYNAATNQQQSLTVDPKALTVTLNSTPAISKTYDKTTTATVADGNYTLNGVVGSDVVTVSGTASYNNANAGTGKTVTVNNFTLAGAQKNNYIVSTTSATTTGAISALAVTVTANTETKVYGQSDPALTYTPSPALLAGDSFTGSLTRDAGENVGAYAIKQGTLSAGTNYSITYVGANLAITPKTLNVSAHAQIKTYGAADPTLTYSVSGLVPGDGVSGTLVRTAGNDVGIYAITQGSLTAGNNYAIQYTGADLTITKKTLVITAEAQTKTYGDPDPVLTYTVYGLVGSDVVTGELERIAGSNVGPYAINQGTISASANYTITYSGADLMINPKAISVNVQPKSKVYGEADPALTYTATPALVSGDAFSGALSRVAGEDVGAYAILQNTLTLSANYILNYTGAPFTIKKKAVTVTADAKSKTYGNADPALTYTVSPVLVSGDSFTGALARAVGEDVGTYTIDQATLTLGGNYEMTYVSAGLTIGAKTVTVTAEAKTKTYGEADPALTYTVAPALINGDVFTGTLSREAGEQVGDYTIQQHTLALSNNYILNYTPAHLTIGKKAVTLFADAKSKTYGAADPALTYTASGLVGSDAVSGLLERTAGEDAGHYAIFQGSITAGNNYTIDYTGADLTIAPKGLLVNAEAKTKTYGAADPALTYSVSGLVGTDAITGNLERVVGNNVGVYAINQGSLTAGSNYTITYTGANLTITPKAVAVAAQAKSKTYGQQDPAFTYTVTPALVSGDAFSGALNRTPGEDAGTYAIQQGSLANPNYAISFTEGVFTIEKAAQQITWIQTLTTGCDGITRVALTATANSGLPVSYSSSDATIATINGTEAVMTGPGTVTLSAAQPGNHNYLPATPVTNTMLAQLPAHLVAKRWDDVLVFDNSSNQYNAWQWYKNEIPVSGATGQYYYESGKLNGAYYAIVKTINGIIQQTCPVTITPASTFVPIAVFPNPVTPGQTITVTTEYSAAELQGATIVVSNMLGVVVQTLQNVTPQTTVSMPVAQGVYVVRLRLTNGVTASVNVLVKPH